MSGSTHRRLSAAAVVAASLASSAACGGSPGRPAAGLVGPLGPKASASTSVGAVNLPGSNVAHRAPTPTYNATVPTVSNGTDKVLIDHVPVTFPSTVTDASWSPDGTRLVYVDSSGDIATARPDGSGVLVLTAVKPGVKRAQPVFEDGGGEIVFSERGTDGVWRLMSVSADGSDAPAYGGSSEALLDSIGDGTGDIAASAVYNPAVVKMDGPLSVLAYQHQGGAGAEIWILDRNQRGPRGMKARDGAAPALSPDGAKIAFVGGDGQLYTEALPITGSGVAVRLTSGIKGLTHPVWSPDGSRLAFGTATDVESVAAAAPASGGVNAVTVESASPGVAGFEPMTPTSVLRFASTDPVAGSVAQSAAYFATVPGAGYPPVPTGRAYAHTVTLVGTSDPAALAVAALGSNHGAILFTRPDTLSPATAAEIRRVLGPLGANFPAGTLRIVGGDTAVSPGVRTAVAALGYQVTDVPDGDAIGQCAAAVAGGSAGTRLFLVSATDTPAILSLVATGRGGEVLLTDNSTMPAVDEPILDRLNYGGQSRAELVAVGAQAQAAVRSSWPGKPAALSATPVGTADADFNSVLIARRYSDGPTEVALTTTASWQDALLAAANGPGMPMLAVDPKAGLSTQAVAWLEDAASSVSTVVLYGDATAVPEQIAAAAAAALDAPAGVRTTLNPKQLLPL
ncbi:MAG TPA: hypothetical protein VFU73_15580 [Actinocrinis sp.]|nr:hypothetical protein [Actinocrinis sp.]